MDITDAKTTGICEKSLGTKSSLGAVSEIARVESRTGRGDDDDRRTRTAANAVTTSQELVIAFLMLILHAINVIAINVSESKSNNVNRQKIPINQIIITKTIGSGHNDQKNPVVYNGEKVKVNYDSYQICVYTKSEILVYR